MAGTHPATADFEHPAFFYRSDDEYLATLVPFIADGLSNGDPVAVAVPGERLVLLQEALGDLATHVQLVDMAHAGRNPGRIIAGVLRAFADDHRDRRVRIIGEPIWRGRSDVEYPACVQHEALINTAFADRNVVIVCPYDLTRLDPLVVSDAIETHPLIWEATGSRPSDRYSPQAVLGRYNLPLPGPRDAAEFTVTDFADLAAARRFAAEHAAQMGLASDPTADLVLIVTELATNSLRHASRTCDVRIWCEDEHFVCEVGDTGRWVDPLAGRRPAEDDRQDGRGLLMVNDLAALVRVHTRSDGTTIRAYLPLAA